jgi:hypothetical protein
MRHARDVADLTAALAELRTVPACLEHLAECRADAGYSRNDRRLASDGAARC